MFLFRDRPFEHPDPCVFRRYIGPSVLLILWPFQSVFKGWRTLRNAIERSQKSAGQYRTHLDAMVMTLERTITVTEQKRHLHCSLFTIMYILVHYGENVHGYNGHVQEKDFKFIGKNVNSWKHCSQGPKLNTQFWDRSRFHLCWNSYLSRNNNKILFWIKFFRNLQGSIK